MIDLFSVLLYDYRVSDANESRKGPLGQGLERDGGHRILVDSRAARSGVEAENVFDGDQVRGSYVGPQIIFSGRIFFKKRQSSLRSMVSQLVEGPARVAGQLSSLISDS